MHSNRIGIGVSLIAAVAVMGWCSMATPVLADGTTIASPGVGTSELPFLSAGSGGLTPRGGNCDSQVGINGGFIQACNDGQWVGVGFTIDTTGVSSIDVINMTHNSNTGIGDLYLMADGGGCPDINNILWSGCGVIVGQPNTGSSYATGGIAPAGNLTWIVAIPQTGFAMDHAYNSQCPQTGGAFGELVGTGECANWTDLDAFGFGFCYCVSADTDIGEIHSGNCNVDECAGGGCDPPCAPGEHCEGDVCVPDGGGPCDDPNAGDCCDPLGNGTPGCNDPACCEAICAADPFCCDNTWDGLCAAAAIDSCDVCGGGGEGETPDNDQCEGAAGIANGDTVDGTTSGADSDGSASCGASENSPDVWYVMTAQCNGTAHADTCGSADYDTVLSVHSGCPGEVGNEITCNDDFCGLQSGVDWAITAGTQYWIRVSGFSGGNGDFVLTVDKECVIECDPACNDLCEDCVNGECVDTGNCCAGTTGPNGEQCAGDVNGDGVVSPLDSGAVLARFGLDPCNEENCQYDVNCDGAISPLDSGFILARFGQCQERDKCKICDSSGNVFNDNCEDAPVDALSIDEKLSYQADSTDATSTCAALGTAADTWHAFDLQEDADVNIGQCGTDPVWGNAFVVLDQSCPCSGNFIFFASADQTTCDDGNWTVHYTSLPAGVYYSPVLVDAAIFNPPQKYSYSIAAKKGGGPPPACNPEAGDCCVANGSPGCNDEACCTELCALDPFCCDIEWDSICAGVAVDTCAVCGGGGDGPEGPENDDCADRSPLSDGVTPFDTNGATTDGVNPLDPSCEKGFGLDLLFDIWYEYVASCTGTVTISTCDAANYDTRLAAYIGQDCPAEAFAGCNDDGAGCGGFTSIMTFPATAGQSYKIRVGGFGGTGTGNLTVSCN